MGSTGSGKSTISRLLFRYFDVTAGSVLVDGQVRGCPGYHPVTASKSSCRTRWLCLRAVLMAILPVQDVRSVAQTTLRAAIGIVPQDAVLFNDTIRHNIACVRAARAAAACRLLLRMLSFATNTNKQARHVLALGMAGPRRARMRSSALRRRLKSGR